MFCGRKEFIFNNPDINCIEKEKTQKNRQMEFHFKTSLPDA